MTAAAEVVVPLRACAGPLVAGCDAALVDLDGTVYVGPDPLPGVADVVAAAEGFGVRCCYLTNNASRTAEATAAHLRALGIPAAARDVVTSAQAAAALLAARLPPDAAVLVVGGVGLTSALDEVGLRAVFSADDGPLAVVQGFAPEVGWAQLAEGAYAVARGLPWVATNRDLTLPTPRGQAPGNGALVEAVRLATGVDPVVAGKPERPLLDAAVARTGARAPLVVGDRLDTDVACAVRAGVPSLLVLTGVTDAALLLAAPAGQRPTYLSARLDGLLSPHPAVSETPDGGWSCRGWTATVRADVLELAGPAPAADDGEAADALRAAAAAAWAAQDRTGMVPDLRPALGVLPRP